LKKLLIQFVPFPQKVIRLAKIRFAGNEFFECRIILTGVFFGCMMSLMKKKSALLRLVEEFLESLQIEKNCSPLTIRNYRQYLHRFLTFLSPTSVDTPQKITLPIVKKYRLYLANFIDEKGLPLSRTTQSYYLIGLRAFLRWLNKNDYRTLAPEKIDLPKSESVSLKFLDREQIERLLGAPSVSTPQGLRDKAILELLFSTGLRVSELAKLNRDQIDFKRREFGVIGKGRRPRVVFLSNRAVKWLKRYLQTREDEEKALFIRYSGKGKGQRLSVRSIQRIVKKYGRQCRLPIEVTPHVIRHSYATDLLRAGADIRSVQEMLGHKNISTTQIYTHVTNKRLREIYEKYHNNQVEEKKEDKESKKGLKTDG